ncbi:MAG: hypothetical protein WDO14_23485 [Bacteroidota bacterium]
MEKERFLDLAINYTSLTEAESKDLDALQKQFPYSQVIHNLASRGAQDNKFESSKKLLNISAVYSTDRSVLKDIITTPRTQRADNHTADNHAQEPIIIPASVDDGLHGEALNIEIMHDLERLQELKHNFELSFEEFQHSKTTEKSEKASSASPVKKKEAPVAEVAAEPSTEGLLEEIKTTKKKIIPETSKQKEQIDIIDKFIKRQPSIAKNTGNLADASDLAEKNFALTENIVSETLVEILLRQGKKDKAIEVLKKLIWKFPQKKAIFAAQIEELKK